MSYSRNDFGGAAVKALSMNMALGQFLSRILFIVGLAMSLQSCGGGGSNASSVPIVGVEGNNPLTTYTAFVGGVSTLGDITAIAPFVAGAPPDHLRAPAVAPKATIVYADGTTQTADEFGNFDVSQSSYVQSHLAAIASDPTFPVEVRVLAAPPYDSFLPDHQFVDPYEPAAGVLPISAAVLVQKRQLAAASPPSSVVALVVTPSFKGLTSVERSLFHVVGVSASGTRVPLGGVNVTWTVGKPPGCSPSSGAGSVLPVSADPSKVTYVPPVTGTIQVGCPDLVIASMTVNGAMLTAYGQALYRFVETSVKISGMLSDFLTGKPLASAVIDLYGPSTTPTGTDGVVAATNSSGAWSANVFTGRNLTPAVTLSQRSPNPYIPAISPQSIPIPAATSAIALTVYNAIALTEYQIPGGAFWDATSGNILQKPNPNFITLGSDGASLWFTTSSLLQSNASNVIYRVTDRGNFTQFQANLSFTAGGNNGSYDIVLGPDGALWYTPGPCGDSGCPPSNVGRTTIAGVSTSFCFWFAQNPGGSSVFAPSCQNGAMGIVSGAGKLWIAGGGVKGFVPGSTDTVGPSNLNGPGPAFGITMAPNGTLWFAENANNSIGTYDPKTGLYVSYPIPTAGSYPFRITNGPDGALWFTENLANKIGRITTSGNITEYTFSPGAVAFDIATGPDGALWFTAGGGPAGDKLGRLDPSSGIITEIAIPTANAGIYGITKGPDNAIWFTERTASKIGRFQP